MSHHHLKLLSEAYRNIALAPTNNAIKTDILADLEMMIAKEVQEIRYPVQVVSPPNEEIPF